jgi:hypothetical protein
MKKKELRARIERLEREVKRLDKELLLEKAKPPLVIFQPATPDLPLPPYPGWPERITWVDLPDQPGLTTTGTNITWIRPGTTSDGPIHIYGTGEA